MSNLVQTAKLYYASPDKKNAIQANAKEKQGSGINQYSPSQKSDEGLMRTDAELSKLAGVSRDTIQIWIQ